MRTRFAAVRGTPPAAPPVAAAPSIPGVLALRPTANAAEYELLIYGDIGESWWGESVTAQSVVEQLNTLAPTVTTINVRINSFGGSVADGLAIHNALRRHPAAKVVTVDGVAMSSASLIAMCGDTVQMPATSIFMVHAPWGHLSGNAKELRRYADVLDTYAEAMADAYVRKTGKDRADILALLNDGEDHYYTGSQAVAEGFADAVIELAEAETDEQARALGKTLLNRYAHSFARAPEGIAEMAVAAAARARFPGAAPARSAQDTQPAAAPAPINEDDDMRTQGNAAGPSNPNTPPGGGAPAPAAANPTPAPAAAAPSADDVRAQVLAAEQQRRTDVRARFAPFAGRSDLPIAELQRECEDDPTVTPDAAGTRLLALLGNGVEPAAGRFAPGRDQSERTTEAAVNALMARTGFLPSAESDALRQGNPLVNASLFDLAERSLQARGINTRNMTRDQIAEAGLRAPRGQQTTGDFSVLLENVMHKVLQQGYQLASFTWNRFCATGTLSDYRPHNRYSMSTFSDLLPVNEAGEYQNGNLGDGEKQVIRGRRRGRILVITPEIIVNDDLGAFANPARHLGQAAGRTIEKDVYALFALNGGNGPTMSDGQPLFHSSHANIAATSGAPTVTLIDAARQQMAVQTTPGGGDFLDITPEIFLGPLSLGSLARELNAMEFNDETSKNQRRPNVVRGLFRDVVDTPRLSGNAWYVLAAKEMEPVFEVAFLNGVQTPTISIDEDFRSDGLAWKVAHRYGVGAVGFRGIVKNAGGGG